MKISISDDMLKRYGLSLGEVLYALLLANGYDINELEESLLEKKYIVDRNGSRLITQGFSTRVENLVLDSDKYKEKPKRVLNLVEEMRNLFPEGKKDGQPYYWRGNRNEINSKINAFFKLNGKDTFTDEEILDATKRYVDSFNGNYRFMYLLKYFILKNKVEDGETVQVSELLTFLENKDQTNSRNDWTSEIR